MKSIFFASLIAMAASVGSAHAASFGTEVETLKQSTKVENGLALAIDGSKASVGMNYACGVKAKEVTQTAEVKNGLALAIKNSSAHVGSNVAGDGRCW